jgi:hypothetical protein
MDAWVRVERNYFENVGTAVMTAYSPIVGRVQLIDNVFGSSSIVTSPTCDLQVPYPYRLDHTDSIPSIVTNNVKTAIDNNMPQIPEKFSLGQNYPNPFNPGTVINYQLPAIGTRFIVSLKVFDLLGREVATLENEQKAAGNYSVPFDASKLASGVYFYQLKAGSYIQTKKMLLLR